MLLMIITAIFLGSFTLLFSVWLIVWSWVMSPMQHRVAQHRVTQHRVTGYRVTRPQYKIQEILN
jgi:uncharacterized membrane protein